MNYPKTNKTGFSTHYTITNGTNTFTLIARFHPEDKYWLYSSDEGDIISFDIGESFLGKTYSIVDYWFDSDHWYNEITYKAPQKLIEYHECD